MSTENLKATGTPNTPNARILIYAMQHLGYDNYVALCDIIDNSIDADATKIKVNISQKNKKLTITIQDNGCGMDKSTLDEALKFGSDSNHDVLSDLGKYGMGLSTAGLSLAGKTTVLTKTADSDTIYKSATDVNVIREENAFVKYLGTANDADVLYFNEQLGDNPSGTIVILEDCYGVKNKNTTVFASTLKKEIGRKYRLFMDSIQIEVNGEIVKANDPLMLTTDDETYKSEIYSDEDYEVSWTDQTDGTKKHGKVHVKLVLLPDCSQSKAHDLGINIMNQGFSILRNNREIAFGYMPWFTKHNSFNRIRGEISFDSSLDEAMGVNFTKNNIDMVDSIDNTLQHHLKPQITSMKNRVQRSKNAITEDTSTHLEAEDTINKKAKVLITPPIKIEQRNSPTKKTNIPKTESEKKPLDDKRKLRIPKKYHGANANVRFETVHCGASGPIFEAEQEGKTTVINWNVDHPFYTRFVRENSDNKTLVTSVDFLIYSLAVAQIQAIGDDNDKAQMVENILSIMSTNMKVLLS